MSRSALAATLATLIAACGSQTAPQPEGPADPPPAPDAAAAPVTDEAKPAFQYPEARRGDVVDDYFGTKVADPYRWLEDPDSPESRAWIEAENELTFGYLKKIEERGPIHARLEKLWNYERYGLPTERGGRYFFFKNDGLQNQSVLYWTASLDAAPKVLLDPNKWSEDGTVALSGMAISDDGKHVAYGVQRSGSDWREWHVVEVGSGAVTEDKLEWIKFSSPDWSPDSRGFYYSRYPEPPEGKKMTATNLKQKLYYHRLGTPQSADRVIYQRPDMDKSFFDPTVTDDGRYLVITTSKGTANKNLVHVRALRKTRAKFIPVIAEFENDFRYLGNDGTRFFFFTDADAPRGRVIRIDIRHPEKKRWTEIVPQSKDTLRGASIVGKWLIASYMHDARSRVSIFDLHGKAVRDVALPGLGTAGGFDGRRKDHETFYRFTSYTSPSAIYRYDLKSGKQQIFRRPEVDFDGDRYVTEQVFYKSADGTRVPMFVTHKKGMARDGSNPTLLTGYGGFDISLMPGFSPSYAVWLEMGGVLAVPNLRGGGEYGEEWHQQGTKLKKQNVFDDFIAAAEYLIAEKITRPDKLAIYGASNGGLLIGAVMTQRPELFGAALPAVGVMDMLRFHKFTIGWAWVDDYGSSDDPEQFKALYAYSPYHNLEEGVHYPSTMVTTADHDDRVVPGHSFKFAAALQHAHKGDNPVLIRIQTKAGHGSGKPTSMKIDESADRWAFLVKSLGMKLDW